jgi:hypothetical protein
MGFTLWHLTTARSIATILPLSSHPKSLRYGLHNEIGSRYAKKFVVREPRSNPIGPNLSQQEFPKSDGAHGRAVTI